MWGRGMGRPIWDSTVGATSHRAGSRSFGAASFVDPVEQKGTAAAYPRPPGLQAC